MHTLPELLTTHLDMRADALLLRALPTHEKDQIHHVTYGQMHQRATSLASKLLDHAKPGDRILLSVEGIPELVMGLFACWYASMVAVPIYPPNVARRAADLERMSSVIKDSGAAIALIDAGRQSNIDTSIFGQAVVLDIHTPGNENHTTWPNITPEQPALIQYTSGSTGVAKGVVLSHSNVLANLELFAHFAQLQEGDHIVNWMPLFHDLGLSLFLCAPFIGSSATLLTPEGFLRRPARWLEAISTYDGVLSGAPNFAYDLCSARISNQALDGLNLSRWRVAMNAAEPVRASTIERFVNTFGAIGFQRRAMMPCYGLAEATAYGTAGRGDTLEYRHLDAEALRAGRVELIAPDLAAEHSQILIGCGRAERDAQVLIVDADNQQVLPDAEIGEIWLAGPQIGLGYWGREELSNEIFGATLNEGTQQYLRTGDLGFLLDGQLFVTGRLKDLIVIRGQNHYPQDIEASVVESHSALRPGCSAAFSVQRDGAEQLVVVAEIRDDRYDEIEAITEHVRAAISKRHGLNLHGLMLLPKRHIHKTSSGKIKRAACQQSFENKTFETIHTQIWHERTPQDVHPTSDVMTSLVGWIAQKTSVDPSAIAMDMPFVEMGIDSLTLIELLTGMEEMFDTSFDVSIFFEYPTLEALAEHLNGIKRTPVATHDTGTQANHRIAIIGSACQLPGDVRNIDDLWSLIDSGRSVVGPIPETRWAGVMPRPTGDEVGGFLNHVDLFDAQFFGISAKEAAAMDPQQRLLLEVVWHALEDAGVTLEALKGSKTGVFIGISASEYIERSLRSGDPERVDAFAGTASATSVAAGRIAYILGTTGPTMAIDTACSSSLVALHMATRSVASGECDAAIVAGVNIVLSPAGHVYLNKIGAMSQRGHCEPFGDRADGYVRAEGCVALVIRPESHAQLNGDKILGSILGSSINHDGRTNGLTAPSISAQRECYTSALDAAGIQPTQVDYIEAHGTGTKLGDPIEVQSIAQVYGQNRAPDQPIQLGAVKAQVGHGETVAGLTGVLKVLAMFAQKQIPAQPGIDKLNTLIDWPALPVNVPTTHHRPWRGDKLTAAVSSFGISGTNAHIILACDVSASPVAEPTQTASGWLIPISARSPNALIARAHDLATALTDDTTSIDDIVYTASQRRAHLNYRVAIAGETRVELIQKLNALEASQLTERRQPQVVFVFSGHGSQWEGMGRALMQFDVCRQALEQCEHALSKYVEWSLIEQLTIEQPPQGWGSVDRAQPMIFAIEVALAALWQSWGVKADAVIGHSMGEIAAFYHAGALTLDDAARIICTRSRLMRRIEGEGEMLVLGVPRDEAEQWIAPWSDELAIGVHNSPDAVVLSGSANAIQQMMTRAEQRGLFARRVKIDVASHSPQTEVLRDDLINELQPVTPMMARCPVFSTVLGNWVPDTSTCTANYWFRNLRDSVRFMPSITQIATERETMFVEVSPHTILTTAIKRILDHGKLDSKCVPSMRRGQHAGEVLRDSAAGLYGRGVDLNWAHIAPRGHLVALPPYPFERKRYWLAPHRTIANNPPQAPSMLGAMQQSASMPNYYQWAVDVSLDSNPWLAGHKVQSVIIFPATGALELALSAGKQVFGHTPKELSRVELVKPLLVFVKDSRTVQLEMHRLDEHTARFELVSRPTPNDAWTVHARGYINRAASTRTRSTQPQALDPIHTFGRDACYDYLQHFSLDYHGPFRGIQSAEVHPSRARAIIQTQNSKHPWSINPIALDACLHTLGLAKLAHDATQGISIPKRIERLSIFGDITGDLNVDATAHGDEGDLSIYSANGKLLIQIDRLIGHPLGTTIHADQMPQAPWLHDGETHPASRVVWRACQALTSQKQLQREEVVILGEHTIGNLPHIELCDGWDAQLSQHLDKGIRRVVLLTTSHLADDVALCCQRLLVLSKLVRLMTAQTQPPSLWLITEQGISVPDVDTRPTKLAQAGLCSAANTLRQEHPELHTVSIDTDHTAALGELILSRDSHTKRLAIRRSQWFEARMTQAEPLALISSPTTSTHGTCIITGGFGAVGQQLVKHLVDIGTKRIVILSRRSDEHAKTLQHLMEQTEGVCEISSLSVDVSDRAALASALAQIQKGNPPITGVYHAAGVLNDQMLTNLTEDALRAVFEGKVRGALNLDELLSACPSLEQFVLFSSAASVLGSPGQTAYAAANALLTTIAQRRQQRGLPGVSIPLGPVLGAGMAQRGQNAKRLEARGVSTLELHQVTPVISAWLRRDDAHLLPLEIDLKRLSQFHPTLAHAPFFSELNTTQDAENIETDNAFLIRLRNASQSGRVRSMERFLEELVAELLEVQPNLVSRTRSIQELGFDSLLTLELRNQLETILGVELPVSFIWRHPSLAQLASALLESMGLSTTSGTPTDHHPNDVQQNQPIPDAAPIDPALLSMSEGDLLAMLQEELGTDSPNTFVHNPIKGE